MRGHRGKRPRALGPVAADLLRSRRGWALAAATGLLAAGCAASGSFRAPQALHAAPEPAVSPPISAPPAGRLVPIGDQPEGVVAGADGTIAVAVRGSQPGLDLLRGSAPEAPVRFVALAGEARHLGLAGDGGPVLVPEEPSDQLAEVSLPEGRVLATAATGRQPHDAAAVGDTVAVADEFGNAITFLQAGRPPVTTAAPLQPGGIAAGSGAVVVIGVRARVAAAYSPDGRLIDRASCGAGPTHVAAGSDGIFYVTDTLGGTMLVFRLSGRRLTQVARIPVGPRPYGIASDPVSGWVYVTLTGSNRLVGLRMAGARVVARREWPTGRQPNSVAVDRHDGLLAVTATASSQLELIPLP